MLVPPSGGCSGDSADHGGETPADRESTKQLQTEVFAGACRCHWEPDRFADLELYAPGLEARLVGRPSSECAGQILVVPGDPDGSYLFRKLVDPAPACGLQMPRGTPLPDSDVQAVRDWITSLARPTLR